MPFQVVLVSYLIWRQVGIATLSGVLSMVLLTLPVQGKSKAKPLQIIFDLITSSYHVMLILAIARPVI